MKTVTMYHPFGTERPLLDIEHFVDSFFNMDGSKSFARNFVRFPAVDVVETNDAYIVEAELAGYEEKDIEINIDNNTLTIESCIDKDSGKQENENRYIVRERHISQFSRSFKLPENADADAVNAEFKNGLLSLKINKRSEAKKRVIQIGK